MTSAPSLSTPPPILPENLPILNHPILDNTTPTIHSAMIQRKKGIFMFKNVPCVLELRGGTLVLYRKNGKKVRFWLFEVLGSTAPRKVTHGDQPFIFKFKTYGRKNSLYFVCESADLRERWMREINAMRIEIGPMELSLISLIGTGHFGKVFLAQRKIESDKKLLYAVKEIKVGNNSRGALTERIILGQITQNPFLISLEFCFRFGSYIYYGFEFKRGADLFELMRRYKIRMNLDKARFYLPQVVLAVRHLHKHGILYRDLKPENILVDEVGNLCLTDLGLSKTLPKSGKTYTICGTRPYIPPEMILRNSPGYGFGVDFWQLGCFLHELYAGKSPFWVSKKGADRPRVDSAAIMKKILLGEFSRAQGMEDVAFDLVQNLLVLNPKGRLGTRKYNGGMRIDENADLNGWDDVASHPFFEGVDWERVYDRGIVSPFRPLPTSDDDLTVNFSKRCTKQAPEWGPEKDLKEGKIEVPSANDNLLRGFEWKSEQIRSAEHIRATKPIVCQHSRMTEAVSTEGG